VLTADDVCDPSPHVERATKNTTLAVRGSVVFYQCDTGYRFTDDTSATITCDGTNWSSIESSCQGYCSHSFVLSQHPGLTVMRVFVLSAR